MPRASAISLAKRLAAFQLSRGQGRAATRHPGRGHRVGGCPRPTALPGQEPRGRCGSRRRSPPARESPSRRSAHTRPRRRSRGCLGAHHSFSSNGTGADRPAESVLTATGSDYQHTHGHPLVSVRARCSIGSGAMDDIPRRHSPDDIPPWAACDQPAGVLGLGNLRRHQAHIGGEFGRVRVRGEITEMKRYPSGHIYFSLEGRIRETFRNRLEECRCPTGPSGRKKRGEVVADRPHFRVRRAVIVSDDRRTDGIRRRGCPAGAKSKCCACDSPPRDCSTPSGKCAAGAAAGDRVVTSERGAVIQDIKTTIAPASRATSWSGRSPSRARARPSRSPPPSPASMLCRRRCGRTC